LKSSFRVWKVGGLNPGRVKSKTEKLAPVALPWLEFIKGLEQGWLTQRQF